MLDVGSVTIVSDLIPCTERKRKEINVHVMSCHPQSDFFFPLSRFVKKTSSLFADPTSLECKGMNNLYLNMLTGAGICLYFVVDSKFSATILLTSVRMSTKWSLFASLYMVSTNALMYQDPKVLFRHET